MHVHIHVQGLSIHHLLRLHRFMQERLVEGAFLPSSAAEQARLEARALEARRTHQSECSARAGPSHLLVEMQMAMFKISESYCVHFSIYKQDEGFVTEEFKVSQTELGLPADSSLMGRLYSLFADVSRGDVLQEGYLVMKIYRSGGLLDPERAAPSTSSTSTKFQRPFACGVVSLSSISSQLAVGVQVELPECQIFRPRADRIERCFSQTHELIIQEKHSELEEVPLSKGVKLCLTLVQGAMDSFRDPAFLEAGVGDARLREKLLDAPVTLPLSGEEMVVAQVASRESVS
jgi:hypothetical protein